MVLKIARKAAKGLGGSATPLLRKKDNPVASLRLSKAVVDVRVYLVVFVRTGQSLIPRFVPFCVFQEMVLIAECYDGSRRALGAEESPVELLSNYKNGVRRMLLVSPLMLSQLPDAVVTPEEERPASCVVLEDSDEEQQAEKQPPEGKSRERFLSLGRHSKAVSSGTLGRNSNRPLSPTDRSGSGPAAATTTHETPLKRASAAEPYVSPGPASPRAALSSSSPTVFVNTPVAASPATPPVVYVSPPPMPPPPSSQPDLHSLAHVHTPLCKSVGSVVSAATPEPQSKASIFSSNNAWLFEKPAKLYTFTNEREALELVSSSHAKEMQRSFQVEQLLHATAHRAGQGPPPVNRANRPAPPNASMVSAKPVPAAMVGKKK